MSGKQTRGVLKVVMGKRYSIVLTYNLIGCIMPKLQRTIGTGWYLGKGTRARFTRRDWPLGCTQCCIKLNWRPGEKLISATQALVY